MHDAQIRVAIAGAGGRMGRQLIQAALQMEGVVLGAALEREGSTLLGTDAGELAGAGHSDPALEQPGAARAHCGGHHRLGLRHAARGARRRAAADLPADRL